MAKERFIDWKLTRESRERLEVIDGVLVEYGEIRLTLRQLYYRLVSSNTIANNLREYKKLGNLLSKARLAGRIDWDIIEDRVRQADRAAEWGSAAEYCDPYQFRLPRWKSQPNYVELWCEKDAISSVLEPITRELHCVLMVNRGYSSSSAMYDSRNRIQRNSGDKPSHIIYLGDFDPSGEDMVRDIRDRMEMFGVDVSVTKLALNPDQVKKWRLPPNPAKMSDSRAAGFVGLHGSKSYEVDAIPPMDLQKMVRRAIVDLMDMRQYAKAVEEEGTIKEQIELAVAGI